MLPDMRKLLTRFTALPLSGAVPVKNLPTCWTLPLNIGTGDADAYKFLTINTNGHQVRVRVETCQEYTNALSRGAYASTTADMAVNAWFLRVVGTLKFMEKAKASTNTLPAGFLTQLSVSILGWTGSEEEMQINQDTRRGLTLKDYAKSAKIQRFQHSGRTLTFSTAPKDFAIEELARGDCDGDGVEDALIFLTWHYREGSGRGCELQIMTRNRLQPFRL